MAKVATVTAGNLPSNSLQIGGAALKVGRMIKRKTPSELRGEQLKRTNVIELVDESPAPLLGSTGEVDDGLKKRELSRNPRYIDIRMDEVYPAKKSRFRIISGKDNAKENSSTAQSSSLKNLTELSTLAAKKRDQMLCPENSVASAKVSEEDMVHARQTIEKCSQSTFRSVTQLSLGGERQSSLSTADMDKALKGLVAREFASGLTADSSSNLGDPISTGNFCSEFHVAGQKAPLDLTLKTYMRLVSSCSLNWIQRSIMCGASNGMSQFLSQSGCMEDHNISSSSGLTQTPEGLSSKALYSWVYPQSILPPSLMSVLASSTVEGVEMDFLRKRQLAWEDSFRSLYYMLRKNACSVFYVCTPQFVVMFTGGWGSGRIKCSYNAYISQSTRGLRSLLKEHDVYFSMPLCRSKVEQVTTEDLVELSEIEKHNLGQTRRSSSLSDVDNTPQSLLAFSGNENVHGLYDFLLNYRSFLTFLTAVDVPVLYSPVPFQNSALSSPEVRCMEMKRVDHTAAFPNESTKKDGESMQGSSGLCYSIEIKDAYLPPWIIYSICAVMGSEERSFEASFMTERTSVSLNFALGAVIEKYDTPTMAAEGLQESGHAFGIPGAMLTPYLRSTFLRGLKYSNGSYTASLSPV
ncbi:hypothetical protein CFOL_v3_07418 [Cephalotus follicularis]|uniref:Downstream neighbor of Son n=1 Tax=Cephalotus follicularis TaxID=3775 RepID=A0A1Q3B7H0_CEPFO|nr:hypothetical protein CFOL_v3_07418 [Cephalotus follicularis]